MFPPANEEQRLEQCLRALQAAIAQAAQAGALTQAVVAVAAHRCSDATEAIARSVLGAGHIVTAFSTDTTVGGVRSRLADHAVATCGPPDWLFSTDADTQVPPNWLVDILRLGHSYDAVAGLIELSELPADSPILTAHDRLVAAGLGPHGTHRHIYAANLAVRWTTYRDAGGFPDIAHGEEHALCEAITRTRGRILNTAEVRVLTSGRLQGRARHGLANLLAELTRQHRDPIGASVTTPAPDPDTMEHPQDAELSR